MVLIDARNMITETYAIPLNKHTIIDSFHDSVTNFDLRFGIKPERAIMTNGELICIYKSDIKSAQVSSIPVFMPGNKVGTLDGVDIYLENEYQPNSGPSAITITSEEFNAMPPMRPAELIDHFRVRARLYGFPVDKDSDVEIIAKGNEVKISFPPKPIVQKPCSTKKEAIDAIIRTTSAKIVADGGTPSVKTDRNQMNMTYEIYIRDDKTKRVYEKIVVSREEMEGWHDRF